MISKQTFTFQKTQIPYWIKGSKPRLLIISGAHGDEYEVVSIAAREIEQRINALPDFLYIPELSPSAMRRKTRLNENGEDIERNFYDGSAHREACAIMELLRGKKFDFCISFHEDREWKGFYVYDISQMADRHRFDILNNELLERGITLYTGIDDIDDTLLGNQVDKGYVHIPINESLCIKPFFGAWLMNQGIVSHMIVPEVPMRISHAEKKYIIEKCFCCVEKLLK